MIIHQRIAATVSVACGATARSCAGSVVAAVCALCAVLCLTSCTGSAPADEHQATYATLVLEPTSRDLVERYSATIRGRQDIEVYPEVSGKLTQLCVTEGQSVRRGQLLFVIDQVPYHAALLTAEAAVEAARAALATAELTYHSQQALHQEQVVSTYSLQTAENDYLTARASLAQAEAQLVNARNNYSYTEVKSPADGVVGTLPYRVGTLVSPSGMSQPLTTVSDNSQMYVYFSMTERQLLDMVRRYGSKADALARMPEVGLQLVDGSLYGLPGRVESISGVVDRSTGTASLRAEFANPDGLLFSGTSGAVVITERRDSVLVIPQDATYEIQDQVYVYGVEDGLTRARRVEVTRVDGGLEYIVESGLSAGDEVLVEGVGLMQEGVRVK